MADLEGLSATLGDLHQSCDYLLKNFDARQEASGISEQTMLGASCLCSGVCTASAKWEPKWAICNIQECADMCLPMQPETPHGRIDHCMIALRLVKPFWG
eukprot:1799749-Amphidinium_carterae.1